MLFRSKMEASSIGLPLVQSRAVKKSLYPTLQELIEVMRQFNVEVLCYIPGNNLEEGALRLKFPEGQNEETLIQAINVALASHRIVKTDFYEQDPFSFK